jgi:hypothetical protein
MPRRKHPPMPDAILDGLLAGADAKTAFKWRNGYGQEMVAPIPGRSS